MKRLRPSGSFVSVFSFPSENVSYEDALNLFYTAVEEKYPELSH